MDVSSYFPKSAATRPAATKSKTAVDVLVFLLLVAIAVVGRWDQPAWNFTPIAAVGLFAGAYFRSRMVALLAPLTAMVVSNQLLLSYDSQAVMLAVYVMLLAPALAGPWLRRSRAASTRGWVGRLAVAGLAPATAFFLVTNFAVWLTSGMFTKSIGGLIECYAVAVPFYRPMLAGDLLYVGMLFGAASLAGVAFTAAPARRLAARGA